MLLLLLGLILNSTDGYETTVNNTAFLNIFTTQLNGASVSILNTDVTVDNTNNEWDYTINTMVGYHILVNLDETWGFHPTKVSTIKFELDSNDATSSSDRDLIISFSVAASQYISNLIEIDNSKNNIIYPGFDQQTTPTTPLSTGNVLSLVNADTGYERACKVSNNICSSCCNMPTMLQRPNNNEYPLIWKFQNDPINNQLHFEFTNPTWSQSMAQQCGFSTSFAANNGFQIYISGDDNTETFSIKSFNLTYTITEPPTFSPTPNPTNNATNGPTNFPTKYPSMMPSYNPTEIPTNFTTKHPSVISSTNPTKSPTNFPTNFLTKTLQPTLFNSSSVISLSRSPTLHPVQNVTDKVMQAQIDETTDIPTDSIEEKDDTLKDNSSFPIYFIILALAVISIGCIVCGLYTYRNKKKSLQKAFKTSTRNKMDITRIHSVSNVTLQMNNMVMNETEAIEKQFVTNLSTLVGVNNMLMNDVVSDVFAMNMSSESDCQETPGFVFTDENKFKDAKMIDTGEIYETQTWQTRLPPPPPKAQLNIEMIHITHVDEDMLNGDMIIEGYDEITPNGDLMPDFIDI